MVSVATIAVYTRGLVVVAVNPPGAPIEAILQERKTFVSRTVAIFFRQVYKCTPTFNHISNKFRCNN